MCFDVKIKNDVVVVGSNASARETRHAQFEQLNRLHPRSESFISKDPSEVLSGNTDGILLSNGLGGMLAHAREFATTALEKMKASNLEIPNSELRAGEKDTRNNTRNTEKER